MSYKIKLKTGFYEKTIYDLSFSQGLIQFISSEDLAKEVITIPEKEITAINITRKKHTEIEIHTAFKVFIGTFIQDTVFEEFRLELRQNIRKKIVFEEF